MAKCPTVTVVGPAILLITGTLLYISTPSSPLLEEVVEVLVEDDPADTVTPSPPFSEVPVTVEVTLGVSLPLSEWEKSEDTETPSSPFEDAPEVEVVLDCVPEEESADAVAPSSFEEIAEVLVEVVPFPLLDPETVVVPSLLEEDPETADVVVVLD